jgi:predicted GNAT superfamily acetyltransferase
MMTRARRAPRIDDGEVTVRPVVDPAELRRCAALYREVFEIPSEDAAVTHRLLVSIHRNSGTVTGAFLAGRLVGFTYSFLAREPGGRLYHYSQLAVVASEVQGRGVGRALKFGQRRAVLAQGIELIRWSFDPLLARNAHFNLNVLGCVGRAFCPDLYGSEPVDRDRGLPTPRMLVDWELGSRAVTHRVQARPPVRITLPMGVRDVLPGDTVRFAKSAYLAVPLDWDVVRRIDLDAARDLQERTGRAIETFFAEGFAAVTCQRTSPTVAIYRFAPEERG